MLKRLLQIGMCAAGLVTLQAQAIIIDDTSAGVLDGSDVGVVDTFLGASTGITGIAAEVTYINSLAGTTFTKDDVKEIADIAYYSTDTADTFAADLTDFSEPGFFLVKNSTWTAVFKNLLSLDFGVFTSCLSGCQLNSADFKIGTDDFTISHITAAPGGGTVPEPGILTLMGLGLLGLGFTRRRRQA